MILRRLSASLLIEITSPVYEHYGMDARGVYRTFTADELIADSAGVVGRVDMEDTFVSATAIGAELVVVEMRSARRSRVSDASCDVRWVVIVHVVEGLIVRTTSVFEQAADDFWRRLDRPA